MSKTEILLSLPPNEINSYGLYPIYLPDAREAEVLHALDEEGLPCPQCACDLFGEKRVTQTYIGVVLECIECGYCEH